MGDSSDNIPGVKGIGEKTGMSLIQSYGSVAEIYEKLPELELKPAVRKKLEEGKEQAEMSYDLATIRRNAPVDFAPQDALRKPINQSALYQLFSQLEFHKMIEQMGLHALQGDSPTQGEEVLKALPFAVVESEALSECLAQWKAAEQVTLLTLPDLSGVSVFS